MTFSAAIARQALLDALSHGPCGPLDIAQQMERAGCPPDMRYFWQRLAVTEGLTDRVCEPVVMRNCDVIYRLPAHTPMEPRKPA